MMCERAFLPDDGLEEAPLTYESLTPLGAFPIVALSVAYELEIAGLIKMLTASRLPILREERDERHPFILAGGPLTFSNEIRALPLARARE